MDDKDVHKTVFVTHHGLFKCSQMLFVLKNAPATFQRKIDNIWTSVNLQHAIVYIDEITIFSKLLE